MKKNTLKKETIKKTYKLLAILLLILTACQRNIIPPPKNLIAEEKMKKILYDLSIFEAVKNINGNLIASNQINVQNFIYDRYSIDSLQFAESLIYYTSNPKKFDNIIKNVRQKLEKQQDSILQINATQTQEQMKKISETEK